MLGERIKYYRLKEHYSQKEIADQFEVKRSVIRNWETNVVRPTDEELAKLCKILEIERKELVTDVSKKGKIVFLKDVKDTKDIRAWLVLTGIIVGCVGTTSLLMGMWIKNFYVNYILTAESEENIRYRIMNSINATYNWVFWVSIVLLIGVGIMLLTAFILKHFKYLKKNEEMNK